MFALMLVVNGLGQAYNTLPIYHVTASSHYDFGFQLGQQAKELIGSSIDHNTFLQRTIMPYVASPDGKITLNQFIAANNASFPAYFEEIQGANNEKRAAPLLVSTV
jgi:hypothetical protein